MRKAFDHRDWPVVDRDAEAVYESFEASEVDVEDRLELALHCDPVHCQAFLHRLFDCLDHPLRIRVFPSRFWWRYCPLCWSCRPENVVHVWADKGAVIVAGICFAHTIKQSSYLNKTLLSVSIHVCGFSTNRD